MVSSLLAAYAPGDQVTPTAVVTLPDPDDEIFLATALATPDRILVTGNGAHFPAALCAPVRILTPAMALSQLTRT